jgi:hypothetical protein
MKSTVIFEDYTDNESRLTRQQVANRLRVSIATVRRMEGRELHPQKNDKGVWTFDASEVMRLAESRVTKRKIRKNDEGEIAARVFELFESGCELPEIVYTLRQPPRVIRDLYSEWLVGLRNGEKRRQREQMEAKLAQDLTNFFKQTQSKP